MWALSQLATIGTFTTLLGPVISLFYLFAGTGIAAYDFLCPNLHLLSLHTGLSEAVIGATFIAFGNASGDIFSAFVALHRGNSSLAVGSIIGAAFFIICVVIGALAIIQPSPVDSRIFLRDACFLVVAVTLIVFVVADGKITIHESVGLVVLYIIYATVVVIRSESRPQVEPEYTHGNYMHLHPELDDGPIRPSLYGAVEHFADQEETLGSPTTSSPPVTPDEPRPPSSSSPVVSPDSCTDSASTCTPSPSSRYVPRLHLPKLSLPKPQKAYLCHEQSPQQSPQNDQQLSSPLFKRSPALSICSGISGDDEEITNLKQHLLPGYFEWSEKSLFQKIITVIMWPMLVALQVSIPIPQTKEGRVSKNLMTVYAVSTPLALYGLVMPHDQWEYAVGTLVSIALLITGSRLVRVNVLFPAFVGFSMAVIWILNLAAQMVEIVKFIGGVLNISKAVLGLTVVAIGNSLGDLVSNISIARSDHSTMALSACFGSPLLLILIGLGGASLLAMAMNGSTSIEIEQSSSVILTCILLLGTLLMLTLVLPLNSWQMSRGIGALCISVWVINVILNLTIYL